MTTQKQQQKFIYNNDQTFEALTTGSLLMFSDRLPLGIYMLWEIPNETVFADGVSKPKLYSFMSGKLPWQMHGAFLHELARRGVDGGVLVLETVGPSGCAGRWSALVLLEDKPCVISLVAKDFYVLPELTVPRAFTLYPDAYRP